jgi:hypothetical protein
VLFALLRSGPLIIHTFESELLDMARWCEAQWPGEKIAGPGG